MALDCSQTFEGIDEIKASYTPWPFVIGGYVALYLAIRTADWALASIGLGLLLMAIVGYVGRRYRCTVSANGITLERLAFFVIPTDRSEHFLDARIKLYEPLTSTSPEGLEVGNSGAFGPYYSESAQRRLYKDMRQALQAARRAAPAPPAELRCPVLEGQCASLRISERSPQGTIKRAVLDKPVEIHDMTIPPSSVLVFNDRDLGGSFRDPRRDDELSRIECSDEVTLPTGHTVEPGAVLWVTDCPECLAVEDGFDGPVDIDGLPIDGTAHLMFGEDGELIRYTLADPVTVDGFTIPEGSTAHHHPCWPLGPNIYVTLGAATEVGGRRFQRGDSLQFVPRVDAAGITSRLHLRDVVFDATT